MRLRKIIKMFEDGNVSICGLRGRGKDMLMANVIVRRGLPYISNINYGGNWIPFNYEDIDCGKNTFENFISGKPNKYVFPHPDGTDVYISDAGIYFPSQYCSDLNRKFQYMSVYQAISRHCASANFHYNAQALNRVWDKIREQSDQYVLCRRCIYIKGIVLQWVTIYDRYQSALDKQRPFRLPITIGTNKVAKLQRKTELAKYEAQYGSIRDGFLIYRNKSTYNTRFFRDFLKGDTHEGNH